jgi:c-di-GMP-binding flagellar brake protein YcgR
MQTPEKPTPTPAKNGPVTLAIPSQEEIPARVAGKAGTFIDLTFSARPRTPVALLEGTQAYLEYVTDDGMWRMLGTVHVRATEQGEIVRFEQSGRPPQLLQRRAYVRTDLIAMMLVTAPGGKPQRCMTLNVSGGGVLVRGLREVAEDTEVDFDLRLDLLPARIQGRCRVVRQTPDGCHGLQFTEIDDGDRDRLVRFAYQREKAAREARFGY